jgi:hypothetical protein
MASTKPPRITLCFQLFSFRVFVPGIVRLAQRSFFRNFILFAAKGEPAGPLQGK